MDVGRRLVTLSRVELDGIVLAYLRSRGVTYERPPYVSYGTREGCDGPEVVDCEISGEVTPGG